MMSYCIASSGYCAFAKVDPGISSLVSKGISLIFATGHSRSS